MPDDLAKVVRSMWDPKDSNRPDFLEVIERLEPIAMKYQAEEEKVALAKCCVVS